MFQRKMLTALCALTVLLSAVAVAENFDELLEKVADYQYGDSREALTELSDMLKANYGNQDKLAEYEKKMLKVLSSDDVTFAGKQFLCKELSIMGTENAVPILVKLLDNEKEANIARYALERIPSKKVDAALRTSLESTSGNVQIGIINTIGNRADEKAVSQLSPLLFSDNKDIARAAAAALGKIGTVQSANKLQGAISKTKVPGDVLHALLKNAEQLAEKGEKKRAMDIYLNVRKAKAPEGEKTAIQAATLTGEIRLSDDPTAVITEALASDLSAECKAVAISMVHQSQKELDLKKIAAVLPDLSPRHQIQLLTAFKVRGDQSAHAAVRSAVDYENKNVRVAAIDALSKLGTAPDVELLAQKAATGDQEEQEAARHSLSLINAPGVNEQIVNSISSAETKVTIELVRAIGERNMSDAVPTLVSLAREAENRRVGVEAIKALGLVGQPDDLDTAIDILIAAKGRTERRESERMVVAIAKKIDNQDEQGDAVLAAYDRTDDIEAKSSLLHVAGRIGDRDALTVMQNALNQDQEEFRVAAIRALSKWPTPEPLNNLLNLAQNGDTQTERVLALRGYIQLLGLESDRPVKETVDKYRKALDLAENANEKRMVMSGLANVHDVSALLLAAGYLDDPDVKNEAEVAVVQIGWRARDDKSPAHQKALEMVKNNTKDENLKEQADRLLQEFE